jgi:DNA-binding NarL/FixJ family response regulator
MQVLFIGRALTMGRHVDLQTSGGRGLTRVMIVDDHRAFAEALGIAIDAQWDLECVGIASTVQEAVDKATEHQPDVVLMDFVLPDLDGIEGTRRLKEVCPETQVVMLTGYAEPDVMAQAAASGACGFLAKESPVGDVIRAIRTASEGGMLVEYSALAAVLERLRDPRPAARRLPAPSSSRLTQREQEVLTLMAEGLDPRGIARSLGISLYTSRWHVKNILTKLRVHSQLEAVVEALRQGLLETPPARSSTDLLPSATTPIPFPG